MHGKGKFVEVDGSSYEGEWVDGKMQGRGIQVFARGDRYEGEYHNGHRNGKGKQTFANGNMYDGQFLLGQIHGRGTYTCSDGRVYTGDFKNNKKHGQGRYAGGNGSYTGAYADGKKHGRGTFTWADGSAYDGEWADDVMHGTGIRTNPDGTRSHVTYNKGQLEGNIATLSSSGHQNHLGSWGGLGPGAGGGGAGRGLKTSSMPNMRNAPPSSLGGAKRTVMGKKGKGAMSSADAIAEEGLHLDDKYEGPLGDMRRNWDEFSSALNCYGAVTAARDSCAPSSSSSGRKDRGTCDPGIWS